MRIAVLLATRVREAVSRRAKESQPRVTSARVDDNKVFCRIRLAFLIIELASLFRSGFLFLLLLRVRRLPCSAQLLVSSLSKTKQRCC